MRIPEDAALSSLPPAVTDKPDWLTGTGTSVSFGNRLFFQPTSLDGKVHAVYYSYMYTN